MTPYPIKMDMFFTKWFLFFANVSQNIVIKSQLMFLVYMYMYTNPIWFDFLGMQINSIIPRGIICDQKLSHHSDAVFNGK